MNSVPRVLVCAAMGNVLFGCCSPNSTVYELTLCLSRLIYVKFCPKAVVSDVRNSFCDVCVR